MSAPRAGTDAVLAARSRRRARAARHVGVMLVLFGALAAVGVLSAGATLGRWDLPFVEDAQVAGVSTSAAPYTGPTAPACGPDGTAGVAEPAAAVVRVVNGTSREGLAQGTADELAARGFVIADIGGTRLPVSVTEVTYPFERQAEALTLAAHVGTAQLVVEPASSFVTVKLGTDFVAVAAPDQAAAALAAGVLPGCPGVVVPVTAPTSSPSPT